MGEAWEGSAEEVRDVTIDAAVGCGEVLEVGGKGIREGPWRKGVVVEVDGAKRGKAGEEVGGDGGEGVGVEKKSVERGEGGEGGERAGEAVRLELQMGNGCEVGQGGREGAGERAVAGVDGGDAAGGAGDA